MKKLLPFFICLLFFGNVKAQYVTIPDSNFVVWLQANVPAAMTGPQMDTANLSVTNIKSLTISSYFVKDFTGIQYFDSLTYLDCSSNYATSIAAWPALLDTLICNYNKFSILPSLPANLKYLDCSQLYSQLTSLPALPSNLEYLNCGSNALTGLPALPATLKYLRCGGSNLTNLPALPNSLVYLDCFSNSLTTLPTLSNSIDTLICSNNHLTGLPALSTSLVYLNCLYNQITSLPPLPSLINYIDCSSNSLANLPSLPTSLQTLICPTNSLTALPALNSSLKFIDCSYNALPNLPSLPNSLISLYSSSNQLTGLPALPNSLVSLYCTSNQLTSLPTLPNSLLFLYCDNNVLTSVPTLPTNLDTLSCTHNPLGSLPSLPGTLKGLYCNNSSLTSLPLLPNSLINLYCSNNSLTGLPPFPNSLINLYCDHNSLTSLPVLPNFLSYLVCNNNNLSCLPFFPGNMALINVSNNPFSCVPNYNAAMDPTTLAFPLCTPGNFNACPTGQGVNGYVYGDNNMNCIKDAGDSNMINIPVKFYSNGMLVGQAFGSSSGLYGFSPVLGTYTVVVDTTGTPFISQCLYPGLDSVLTISSSNPVDTNINFGLICKPGFDVGVQSILFQGTVFPGLQHRLVIVAGDMSYWYNKRCSSGISGQVQITVTGNVSYVGPYVGALTPIHSGNTFTYAISDFGLIHNWTDFNLIFKTDTTAQLHDTICVTVTVSPNSGDNHPENNTSNFCYEVGNSHDPNLKEVFPIDVASAYNDWFTYTIHFQNTGTAAAMNIRLADTLNNNLDLNTFQLLNYSHQNNAYVNGNIVTFYFPNVNLPDSTTNLAGSQGYVQYRIKPKANLPAGAQIKNTAYIYFDYNPAVITNTTVNHFLAPNSVKEIAASELSVFPNPVENEFIVKLSKNSSVAKISLYSVEGNLILEKISRSNSETINTNGLTKGIYILKVESEQKVFTQKLIKN